MNLEQAKFAWYTVAQASTIIDLNEKCAALLQDAWEPAGGIAIGKDTNGEQSFFQAFVRNNS